MSEPTCYDLPVVEVAPYVGLKHACDLHVGDRIIVDGVTYVVDAVELTWGFFTPVKCAALGSFRKTFFEFPKEYLVAGYANPHAGWLNA